LRGRVDCDQAMIKETFGRTKNLPARCFIDGMSKTDSLHAAVRPDAGFFSIVREDMVKCNALNL
jgi:hypothetical protein